MKQIKTILLILVITVFYSSCEDSFLSPELETGINADNYFKNDAEIEAGVLNIYDGIQGVNQLQITNNNFNHGVQVEFYLTEMRSDNTETKSNEGEAAQFEFFNVEATNGLVDDYYRSYYNVIFRANLVLENLGTASATKSPVFEGEAKFLRAYSYFNLVRLFGDVPLVDKLISPLDKQTAFTRVASTQIYDLIVSDLQTAISNLDDNGPNDRGSKAAAEGILAKVYLTLGRYSEAQTLLESIMNPSRGFALESNFKDVFYNEGNDEVLFAIGFLPDSRLNSQSFSAEWLNAVGRTSGVNYASLDAKTVLDANGGNRTQYSYREDQAQAGKYQVVKYLPDGDTNLGIAPTSADPRSAGNDWVVLRYADILLMHVEAIMAGGASTTSTNAISSFQKVRDRAGLTTAVTSISEDELLLERRVELAFENHRFFDLLRFGKAQDVFSAYSAANGLGYSSTDLLLPIPQREINIGNGQLSQNPGY
ncbi:RagB/SusD family nutrient uptake outer membrane protein [Polaribacter porphyrae]|uniref:RagB/SusD family nutrient uptake outer membrane protein n=1 Tax=Polaribacter porphyrae TaxID=1137780 RepID=A0A2S7WQ37_9FLAO|nr:RagB/SusD family nutrient uptake outer membrane protein [Polaribacter porphyrae]PQJ79730.1 RagB/SusD family nutrient uptake outer membrane protein [Polaribacter porphyrae]